MTATKAVTTITTKKLVLYIKRVETKNKKTKSANDGFHPKTTESIACNSSLFDAFYISLMLNLLILSFAAILNKKGVVLFMVF